MSTLLMSGVVVSIMHLLLKFIEMRFIVKENKPLRDLFRDSLVVFFSVIVGSFVLDQFNSNISKSIPKVFTDMPNF